MRYLDIGLTSAAGVVALMHAAYSQSCTFNAATNLHYDSCGNPATALSSGVTGTFTQSGVTFAAPAATTISGNSAATVVAAGWHGCNFYNGNSSGLTVSLFGTAGSTSYPIPAGSFFNCPAPSNGTQVVSFYNTGGSSANVTGWSW